MQFETGTLIVLAVHTARIYDCCRRSNIPASQLLIPVGVVFLLLFAKRNPRERVWPMHVVVDEVKTVLWIALPHFEGNIQPAWPGEQSVEFPVQLVILGKPLLYMCRRALAVAPFEAHVQRTRCFAAGRVPRELREINARIAQIKISCRREIHWLLSGIQEFGYRVHPVICHSRLVVAVGLVICTIEHVASEQTTRLGFVEQLNVLAHLFCVAVGHRVQEAHVNVRRVDHRQTYRIYDARCRVEAVSDSIIHVGYEVRFGIEHVSDERENSRSARRLHT